MNLLAFGSLSLEFGALCKQILAPSFDLGVLEFGDTAVEETLKVVRVYVVVILVFECLRGHFELVEIFDEFCLWGFCIFVLLTPGMRV